MLGFSELVVTEQELRDVQIATLAIVGSEDRNLARINELKTLMPNMEVLVIDGEKHGLAKGQPKTEVVTSMQY